MNIEDFKSPKKLPYHHEKREEYHDEWNEKTIEERFEYVQSLLKKHGVAFEAIQNLSDKKEQLKFMKEDLHANKKDVYDDFKFGDFDRILEMLLYDKRLFVEADLFSEKEDIGDIVNIYPDVWVALLRGTGVELSADDFTVTIDGNKPKLDAPCVFKTIEISFQYEGKLFKYGYARDEVYDNVIDSSIFKHIEKFLFAIKVNLFFLTLDNDMGSTHFLLPFAVVEKFDRYKNLL